MDLSIAVGWFAQFNQKDVRTIAVVLDGEVRDAENGFLFRWTLISNCYFQIGSTTVDRCDVQIGRREIETSGTNQHMITRDDRSMRR